MPPIMGREPKAKVSVDETEDQVTVRGTYRQHHHGR